jgi:hypothetical protein
MTRGIQDSVSDRRHLTVASTDPVVVGLGRVLLILMALVIAALLAIGICYLDLGGNPRISARQPLEHSDQSLAG